MSEEWQETLDDRHGVTEVQQNQPAVIRERTIIVAQPERRALQAAAFGDSDGITRWCAANTGAIDCVFWNEEALYVKTRDGTLIRFQPEIEPDVRQFFQRAERRYDPINDWKMVWAGDYEEVKFSKKSLLEFLKRHAEEFSPDVKGQIQEMRVTEKLDTNSISLSEDSEKEEEIITNQTSIPKEFTALMRISEGFSAEMKFKARIKRNTNEYGRPEKGYAIFLELANARQVRRQLMSSVLQRLPSGVNVYYGKLEAFAEKGERI